MSNYNVKVEVSAGNKTEAIFRSIEIDDRFYEENPMKTNFSLGEKITIMIEADEISHLRANLNSILRLVQTSNDSIESVKI
jgi:KEOPS complex subunit Pcc1